MIYNFLTDFCEMKTSVYVYSEYTDKNGILQKKPLSKCLKKDYTFKDILCNFKLDWLFKDFEYGNNLRQLTNLARTYPHGSIEYNEIKQKLPGFTWNGSVKFEDIIEYNEIFQKRLKRSNNSIELNGIICIEFDEVNPKDVPDLIQQALRTFPHLCYAGRTLSNKLFCMHRADSNLTPDNYKRYFMELAVQYHNELGINADIAVYDVSRLRFICDQIGARANLTYCDFSPSDNIEIEYGKIFNTSNNKSIIRKSKYVPTEDETLYQYTNGFYYGHGKQHLMQIGELIVPVPSITQIINTLIALGFTREQIINLWENELNYYNYNTNSNDISDCISLTNKFTIDEYKVGKETYNFLCMFFPSIVKIDGFFLAQNEFLCDRYYDMISNAILSHKRILIHGDTGIGKTYFANKLGEQKNVIVIVPYIAHMDNYKSFNPIDNTEEIEKLSAGVIIWDRFVKLFNRNAIDPKSIIIIDESHKLFIDQSYRKAAIDMNNIIHKLENHICYVSATPINEIDVEKIYKFEKERNSVILKHFNIITDDNTPKINRLKINAFLHMIYGNINYYDRIFIASDVYAQKIYDRLYGRFDCQLIRASQKDSPEYRELMKTQLLNHKIIIGTCISYESLNFNNENEKILTITDMDDKTTAHRITQIAGRVRFSKNTVCLLDLAQMYVKTDFKSYAEYYNKLEEIKSKYNVYNTHHYVQDNYDVLDKIQIWYYENSDLELVKQNLPRYIQWKDYEISATMLSDQSPLNIQVKNYIIDYLSIHNEMFNNTSVAVNDVDDMDNMFFGDDNYIRIEEKDQAGMIIREKIHDEQYSYRKLLEYVDYKKINDMIINSHTMPKGVNSEIYRIIEIIKIEENTYLHYIFDLELYLKQLNDIYHHSLKREIDKIKNIRKKYVKYKDDDFNKMYNNIFDMYVIERKAIYDKKTNAAKKTCTITSEFKHPEKYNLTIGQTFESVVDLSTYTNKSNKTIAQWRKKKWID